MARLDDGRIFALGAVATVAVLGAAVRSFGSTAKGADVDWRLVEEIADSWRDRLSDQWEGDLIEDPPPFAWTVFPKRFGVKFLACGATRCAFRLPSGHVLKLPLGEWGETANDSEVGSWYDSESDLLVRDFLVPIVGGGPEGIVMEYAPSVPNGRWWELHDRWEAWSKLFSAGRLGANTGDFDNARNWGLHDDKPKLIDYEGVSCGG